ncbi:MAG: reverse transcriptase domain-containing protein [Roseiarcus sp.]
MFRTSTRSGSASSPAPSSSSWSISTACGAASAEACAARPAPSATTRSPSKAYFASIPHDRLMARVAEKVSDGRVLDLIEGYLRQDVMKGMERWSPTAGTPQGAVISPLLANIYLHPLDLIMEQGGYKMVRYADDFVILCREAEEAEEALRRATAWTTANGLTLHPDKTRMGDAREPGQGFEFLGYRFEGGRRYVRKKSLQAFKDKVRAKTGRTRGNSLDRIIGDLNPMLRGWFAYFRAATPFTFSTLDSFIRRRLRSILRKQAKRPGRGRTFEDHRRWPNVFFADRGLFTLKAAHESARDSR